MITITLMYDGEFFGWELRTIKLLVLGEVDSDGFYFITRVVHREPSDCRKPTVKAMDIPGRAHSGPCI